jgi:hypothetical protein
MWIEGVKKSIKTWVKRGKFHQMEHIYIYGYIVWGLVFNLFSWVLVEGVMQDPSGFGQVSDHFYRVGVDDNIWVGIVSLAFVFNLSLSTLLLLQ